MRGPLLWHVLAPVGLAALVGLATPASAQPRWWVTVGGYAAVERGDLEDLRDVEGGGFLGLGWHATRLGPFLAGVEGEAGGGHVKTGLGVADEAVGVFRGRLGLRLTAWEEHAEPWLVPYVRGGAVVRSDRIGQDRDVGFGWYGGAGIDLRLSEHWFVGPFAAYEQVALNVTTRTWLLGLGLTFAW